MKILQRTSHVLIFRILSIEDLHKTAFASAVFLIIFLFQLEVPSDLTCHRSISGLGRCRLVTGAMLRPDVQMDVPVNQVKEATFDSRRARISLVTQDGATYAFPAHLNSRPEDAARINYFLNHSTQRHLKVVNGTVKVNWNPLHNLIEIPKLIFSSYLWLALIPFYIFSILTGQIVICTFNRSLGKVTIKQQNIYSAQIVEHPLAEIVDVKVQMRRKQKMRRLSNGTLSRYYITQYNVNLVLKSGVRVPLVERFDEMDWGTEKTANCIREFLNLQNNSN